MPDRDATPIWVLVSILFSTHSLDEKLAIALHRVAFDLHETERDSALIDHDLAHGEVRSLKQDAVVGSMAGEVFEAELETERGKAVVRFLLTRQGLELMHAQQRGRQLLN